MKIFEEGEPGFPTKVNLVDENNVFVGYDIDQNFCEEVGYFIADSITPFKYDTDYSVPNIFNLDSYTFDVKFFERVASKDLYRGNMVVFKLVSREGLPDLFLHLYNSHCGYYGHGFEVMHSGEVVNSGCL